MSGASDARVVTVQEIQVMAGREAEFVARFRDLDVFGAVAAAAGGELEDAIVLQAGDRFRVVTTWASRAGIEAWLASDARVWVFRELGPFYAKEPHADEFSICETYQAREVG
jgi:heme-degrading monooxygenase HmoA